MIYLIAGIWILVALILIRIFQCAKEDPLPGILDYLEGRRKVYGERAPERGIYNSDPQVEAEISSIIEEIKRRYEA